ncbi:hypothetical protein Ga0123461_1237 [Mariprofundus aestuarium]|uniref:Sulfotransferase domain-containing protein n=1 Tax=Mariprofundus aestuarium TaxID=1921086 RepID=A0A2K8L600_MARES|nr:sulfotransferase domain-containing protein [Mariprofundus aestuarium]ATX79656.1 hypothetical protein Ga0123461_1237 [Mariprofundus aestuarium]
MKKVIVNALPKSGTNLLAKSLRLMGYREQGAIGSFLVSNTTFKGRVRRFLWRNPNDSYIVGIDSPVLLPKSAIHRILGNVDENGFLSSHLGYSDELLLKILEMDYVPVLVIRDPRAVLASFIPFVVSYKPHALNEAFINMSQEERYQAALHGGRFGSVELASMLARCNALDPWYTHNAVMKVRFEDIVGSRGGGDDTVQMQTLQRLCQALELPQERAEIVAKQLFGPGRGTFRKGQVDSWREELPNEIINQTEQELTPILQRWGYI